MNNKFQISRKNNRNKRIEIHSKNHKEIIIEEINKYLNHYEFQNKSPNEFQWIKERNRKVMANFSQDEVEFIFVEKIQKIKCCDVETYNNKTIFTMKLNNIKSDTFIKVFNERFSSFYHEI